MFTISIVKLQAEEKGVLGMMSQNTTLTKIKILNKKSSKAHSLLLYSSPVILTLQNKEIQVDLYIFRIYVKALI